MLFRMRNTAGLIVLAALAWLAFEIGNSFQQALTIFSIMAWVGAGILATYMILFRGMKFTLFKENEVVPVAQAHEFDVIDGFAPGDVEVFPHDRVARVSEGDVIVHRGESA